MMFAAAILVLIYLMLIGFYFYTWKQMPAFDTYATGNYSVRVSVVVAVRNEENNLPVLLSCLQNQTYPHYLFEIILVNDHCTDRTMEVIHNSFLHSIVSHKVVMLATGQAGKKTAVSKGVENASGQLIITTDADCSMGAQWIEEIVNCYMQSNAVMIVMPVLQKEKSFAHRMQGVELLSLAASTASSLYAGVPLMCNGGNLAFKKSEFDGAYSSNINIATGDDTFLLFYLYKKYKQQVVYLKSKKVLVKTQPQKAINTFMQQRIRWASKVKHYHKPYVMLTGIFLFALAEFQFLSLVWLPFILPMNKWLIAATVLFLPKAIVDFFYLKEVAIFYNQSFSRMAFLTWQFVYPLYVVSVACLSLFGRYTWKERKY